MKDYIIYINILLLVFALEKLKNIVSFIIKIVFMSFIIKIMYKKYNKMKMIWKWYEKIIFKTLPYNFQNQAHSPAHQDCPISSLCPSFCWSCRVSPPFLVSSLPFSIWSHLFYWSGSWIQARIASTRHCFGCGLSLRGGGIIERFCGRCLGIWILGSKSVVGLEVGVEEVAIAA